MTISEFIKILEVLTKLLGALVWPLLIWHVLARFTPTINEFFASLGEFTFKGGGFEASAKRKQAEAAAALTAAAAARADTNLTPESTAQSAREAAEVVAETVTPRTLRKASRATILWVDDQPDNNIYERQSLQALGIKFVSAKSTEEALKQINNQPFDVIISDMGRPPDNRAGYTLLQNLRASGDKTPYIIYSGSNTPEHKAEARKNAAFGSTNSAAELFEYVLLALQTSA